ncbi:type VI secretion system tip protein TssI/VgrG [Polyangium sp. y55x31]|uniref:type VI secretion system Vgr family protein n=1 Tax=Polyangium sp. y55x31 TaxID=3042688 RepID=UPI002482ACAC|nr:type VI secretion system tip protein TssI/VgrG [Polyangium sp. y55x31]MDI1476803.1 type VI secretion system tip protein TssI/VgrG [Polyangium sp. y55x31]
MANLELSLASGQRDLYVRRFSVREAVSNLFSIHLLVRSPDHSLDLGAVVGLPAGFRLHAGYAHVQGGAQRTWTGIVARAEQAHALQEVSAEDGLSTYHIHIVPELWLLTHRQGNRIYQQLSIPDIIDRLLGEWNIRPTWRIERDRYPKLDYKVQYRETDYAFMCRLLEEAGIAYTLSEHPERGTTLVFGDRIQTNTPRSGPPIPYVDNPNEAAEKEFISRVRFGREVRPGAATFRDYDPRKPDLALFGKAEPTAGIEGKMEQYHYDAGSFLVETGKAEGTPNADDRGFARHDGKYGTELSTRVLEAERTGERMVSFAANTFDLAPGVIFSMARHPHSALPESRQFLVVGASLEGTDTGDFSFYGHAFFAEAPYRPARQTPKPRIHGLQSATVVGPSGQEIHVDEFGRVRVQFHWDREGQKSEQSSCWIRVTQGWGGMGYGMITVPRIGHEVLVAYLEGDPDQPVIVGRVYNAAQQVPYKLPQDKTRSTWKSDSSLGSDGFNEIMFEDLAQKELVWQQAQKDRNRNVNNDEFATIVHDRQKLVKNDESEQTLGNRKFWVGKDYDEVTKQNKNETYNKDVHLVVKGSRRERIDGKQSLTVKKSRHEKVEGRSALRAGKEIHHVAGEEWVGEAGGAATIKAPGGFIKLDGAGITISGTMVWINERGEPGDGSGSKPESPFEEQEEEQKTAGESPDDHAPAPEYTIDDPADGGGSPIPV